MSVPSQNAGPGKSNTPDGPPSLHFEEKMNFAGVIIGGMFYGIVMLLFFRCMGALYNPNNRMKEGIKWGLIAYTAAMFLFVTIFTATNLGIQSISYIDNREFFCANSTDCQPGPLGYQPLINSKTISVCRNLMFLLNSLQAGGLLLYRCYVIYVMNFWVIVIPSLMYLTSFVVGIILIYQISQPDTSIWDRGAMSIGLPYFSIAVSLNVLLTLMIVIRLTLHIISIRKSMGAPPNASGLQQAAKAIAIMLVESSALYTVNSLLFIGPWGSKSHIADVFLPILAETQVIASLLVIWRFANRSVSMNTITPGNTGPATVESQGNSASGSGNFLDGYPTRRQGSHEKTSGVHVVGAETGIDIHRDRV